MTDNLWKARSRSWATSFAAVVCIFALHPSQRALSAPAIEEAVNTRLSVVVSRDRIKWGEEVEISVSAVNSTGTAIPGGLYVSFDDDVLVLEVKGGSLLRAGSSMYNLASSSSLPIARPMVESWEQDWKAGVERRVDLVVLPIARERIRVLARATFIQPGARPRIHISPGRLESRSLDETKFPTNVGYVWIARHDSLRRAIRRVERRIRQVDDTEQRRFALALAAALENPKALNDLFRDTSAPELVQLKEGLLLIAPRMAVQLRRDPLVALENMRCLMANLDCHRALVYFGAPLSLYAEISAEEVARRRAAARITDEKGGQELLALLDAEGFSYRHDDASGSIIVHLDGKSIMVGRDRPVAIELLDKIVALLGHAAERTHRDANDMSFASLRARLSGANEDPGAGPKSSNTR